METGDGAARADSILKGIDQKAKIMRDWATLKPNKGISQEVSQSL